MRKPKYLVYLFSAASHSLFMRLNFFDVGAKCLQQCRVWDAPSKRDAYALSSPSGTLPFQFVAELLSLHLESKILCLSSPSGTLPPLGCSSYVLILLLFFVFYVLKLNAYSVGGVLTPNILILFTAKAVPTFLLCWIATYKLISLFSTLTAICLFNKLTNKMLRISPSGSW